ncbi:sugar ABC transporter ATP-binding protein [Bacillota bacterium Meth-B3]|nr:sugar ABC transporter ATP-binding protein [Christensenellaceae bacterium]MEA5066881.1 sugar ABC transporter ATP-binding protein [Eubacteriales bacterium]MEA5067400.1 sugar ABC transporter ATP-binding protein [Christensenellaceae bacterium]
MDGKGGGREYILECSDLSKSFGGTRALDGVQFKVKPGQVHALLGENGAGKSTLMKIIIGLLKADKGQITFEGRPYAAASPAEAIAAGISMIHQELSPEPHLSIAESIFLKREDTRPGTPFLNKKATNERAARLLKEFELKLSPKLLVGELTIAQMQMVEIIKAVSCNARLVIMDEPTSSLDSEETERLFKTIRNLKAAGVTIIYISHRMEEIFKICDAYSVFRDGRFIGSGEVSGVTIDKLIAMMVGREVKNIFPKVTRPIGDVALKVEGLTGKGYADISFEVRRGEILGLSGLVGSGRSETMRAIFGMDRFERGKVFLEGREVKIRSPRDAIRLGIAMINEDRKGYGLCLFRSLRENISLPNLPSRQKGLLLNQRREKAECNEYANLLRVKSAGIEADAFSLSGGNQQKVVLSKWVMSMPKVLILDEPTRGVDVGAKGDIHALMCKFAAEGMAIIMVSSELPEIMGVSDRILIYHEGRLNGEVSREDIESGAVGQEDILAKEFGGKQGGGSDRAAQ